MLTILNLLTRNGLVYMAFRPALTAQQYTQLLELQKDANTADEMRELICNWATAQRLEVSFDELRALDPVDWGRD